MAQARDFSKNIANYMGLGANALSPLISGASKISIHCWLNADSFSGVTTSDNTLLVIYANGSSVGIRFNLDGGVPACSARPAAAETLLFAEGVTGLNTGQLYSLGVEIDFVSDTIEFFIDGVSDGGPQAAAFTATAYAPGTPTTQDAIGGDVAPANTRPQVDGRIAEVAVWKIGISSTGGFAALAKGVSASSIPTPAFYMPFGDNGNPGPENADISSVVGTITGSVPLAAGPTLVDAATQLQPPPWGLIELTSDDSIPPIPPQPQNHVWAVVYDNNGDQAGGIVDIIAANIDEACNRLGLASLTVPLRASGVDAITMNGQIGIWRTGEGEIFRGYVQARDRVLAANGSKQVKIELFSLAIELADIQTWRGLRYEDIDFQTALDDVLSGTGWTATIEGSYPNITKSWDDFNLIEVLTEMAEIGNAFWREVPSTRTLEFRQTADDSGMVMANLKQSSITTGIGIIASVDSIKEDISQLFNRISPEAKADGDILLDMKDSDRSSPYTIQNRFVTVPGIVDIQGAGGSTTENPLEIPISSMGDNRVIAMVVRYGMIDSHALTGISVGGRPMINTFTGIGGPEGDGHYQQGYGIKNPPKGDQAVTMQATDPADDIATWALAIAIRDAEQPFESLDIFAYQQVTGTGAANTPPTIDDPNGSIVISVLSRENNDPAVPVAPYTLEYDEVLISPSGTGVGNRRFFVAMGLGSIFASTSVQWAISNPGDRWFEATFVVRPAKLYYIEDATSIATYGAKETTLPLGTFIKLTKDTAINIANALYDYGTDFLAKHKDPALFYQVNVIQLPLNPLEWIYGSTIRTIVRDEDENIDSDLIAVGRVQEFDSSGNRIWRLTMSDKVQFRLDERGIWLLDQLKSRVAAIQISQT